GHWPLAIPTQRPPLLHALGVALWSSCRSTPKVTQRTRGSPAGQAKKQASVFFHLLWEGVMPAQRDTLRRSSGSTMGGDYSPCSLLGEEGRCPDHRMPLRAPRRYALREVLAFPHTCPAPHPSSPVGHTLLELLAGTPQDSSSRLQGFAYGDADMEERRPLTLAGIDQRGGGQR